MRENNAVASLFRYAPSAVSCDPKSQRAQRIRERDTMIDMTVSALAT